MYLKFSNSMLPWILAIDQYHVAQSLENEYQHVIGKIYTVKDLANCTV